MLLWVMRAVVSGRCEGLALVLKTALLSEASPAICKVIGIHWDCDEYTSRCAETMVAPRGIVTPEKRNPAKLALALPPFPIHIVVPLVTKLAPSSFTSSAALLMVKVTVCGPLPVVGVGVNVGVLVAAGMGVRVGVYVGVGAGRLVLVAVGIGVLVKVGVNSCDDTA